LDMVKKMLDPVIAARRTFCLSAVFLRGEVEQGLLLPASHECHYAHLKKNAQLIDWLTRFDFWKDLSEVEKSKLMPEPGTWSHDDIIWASWQTESLGTLLWCLRKINVMPSMDSLFDSMALVRNIPLLGEPQDFMRSSVLRPPETISRLYKEIELWNWRVHVSVAKEMGLSPPTSWTWSKIIRVTIELANREGILSEPVEDDFPCFGRPFRKLDKTHIQQVASASTERLRALAWITRRTSSWDELPTRDHPPSRPGPPDPALSI